VPVFAASRTAWLGFVALALAYLYVHWGKAIGVTILVAVGILLMFWLTRDFVQTPLEETFRFVFIDRIERQGIEGILGDRIEVYDNYPDAIYQAPWILIIGTGFQNISVYLRATGAHNKFVQAWFELGIIGFIIYIAFLISTLRSLYRSGQQASDTLQRTVAQDMWAVFVAILATMLVGETLWAQYSMFTLTGQIMTLMALAISPLIWNTA
jgi:O-antigen ligase